ncbi:MAG: glycoside hydrolase family 3 C-terminal domain-containing protein [Bifidobacteriaceae bacterium]|jgi:beta-glucosidase|nr:glycoside hydrolase family 3 C-terminal domain-containing protein [Bifidobacteriaceae bacterium]
MKQTHRAAGGLRRSFIAVALATGLAATGITSLSAAPVMAADPVLPYLDQSLPFSVRAADLVSRMTLEEKAQQFNSTTPSMFMGPPAPAIPRLGVRQYTYWQEALHGVARQGLATEFPTGLGIASTWDRDLVQASLSAVSDEARAMYNDVCLTDAAKADLNQICRGLTYWSPTINLARDPRWGRADENYGEDPYLAGEIAGQFVLGLQGGHTSYANSIGGEAESYLKAVSTPKHYLANNSEINRHTGTSNLTDRSLHEYYTAAFGKAAGKEYGAKSMMPSYNAINVDTNLTSMTGAPTVVRPTAESDYRGVEAFTNMGTPVPASKYAIETLLRRMWGFDGFVTSDCGATDDVYENGYFGHNWKPAETGGRQVTPAEGVAWALKAGTDVDCWANAYRTNMGTAQTEGLAPEQYWDVALTRAFTIRMQLGEFDPDSDVPWANDSYTSPNATYGVNAPSHMARAHEMSLAAPTLLKNSSVGNSPALPLTNKSGKTIILGAYATTPVHGGYSPDSTTSTISAAKGVERIVGATNLTVKDKVIHNQLGAKPSSGDSILIDNAGEEIGDPIPFWSYKDVDGWVQSPGFFGPSFSATVALAGQFTIPVNIPSNAKTLRVPLSGQDVLATSVPNCQPVLNGTTCETVAYFDVEIGGTTHRYPISISMQVGWMSNYTVGYMPLEIDLTSGAFASMRGQQDVKLTFGVPNGAGFGLNLSRCTNPTACDAAVDSTKDQYLIQNADNVIVYLGTRESDSNEEADRDTIKLPRDQDLLAAQVAEWNPRTVVWIQSVAQVDVSAFKDKAAAIVWSTYNGEFQGHAVGEVLFNEAVNVGDKTIQANPSGHLPFMYYSNVDKQLTKSTDYALTTAEGAKCGRTYWYYKVGSSADCTAPDYPFGHGLSYTTFSYTEMALSKATASPNDVVDVSVKVTNTGSVRGRAVAQVYVSAPQADGDNRPLRQLKGFAKTAELAPNASEVLVIPLKVSEMWFWDTQGQKQVFDQGTWTVQVGPSADPAVSQTATLAVSGQRKAGVDVVAAVPDGVQLNLQTPRNAIHANLSATRHDQSFWDLNDSAVKVEYTSSNPAVAKVDSQGTVLPVSEGSALITAKVTADGETGVTTFPAVVRDGIPTEGGSAHNTLVDFGDHEFTIAAATAGAQLWASSTPDWNGATYSFLIAPMDLNEIGATVTPGGVLTATRAGKVLVTVVVSTVSGAKVSRSAYVRVLPAGQTPKQPGDASKIAPLVSAAALFTDSKVFSAESWKALQDAVAKAKAVAANPFATQAEIDAAANAVSRALAGLKPAPASGGVSQQDAQKKADEAAASAAKGALAAVVADANALVAQTGKYTPASIQALQAALAQAAAVAANPAATAAEVQAALTAVSKALANLAPAPVVKSIKAGTVKVKGTLKVGRKLTASVAKWTKGASYTYKWYANGKVIKGKTAKTLKLTKSLKGKKIRVKVTGARSGYVSAVKTSSATKKIK